MRTKTTLAAGALLLAATIVATPAAQGPPAAPAPAGPAGAQGGAPGGGRGGRGGGGGGGQATFPAQQRPAGDPAQIARGRGLYDVNCRLCHGADLRGGDMGGVNLLRSPMVFNDQKGELIKPVVTGGRQTPGMPPMPPFQIPDGDIEALAAYLHAVQATMRGQGNPPAGPPPVLNLLVGNAAAGQAYFQAKCSSCHSATGDMAGIGTRIADVMALQNAWVGGRGGGGRGGRGGARGGGGGGGGAVTTATVTLANGQKFEGPLVRYDDFIVVLTLADGTSRSFRRTGDVPKVEIKSPADAHISLLPTYTDKDIHDVTAYLVTLK